MKPDYYDEFQCIADACSLTCCQEWKIAVDRKTAAVMEKQKRRKGSVRKDGPYLIIQKMRDGRIITLDEKNALSVSG